MAVRESNTRASSALRGGPLLEALRAPGPLRAVELRPPPARLAGDDSRDAWIDLDRGVRRLLQRERFVLFTDDAVGDREEESLRVLSDGLGGETDLSRVVPFLTCKHSLEYCRLFGRRAGAEGLGGVTVTGGDREVGVPRCLPRSRDLRAELRPRAPGLPLGAWVNPFRDPAEQVELLMDPEHQADYFLTQVVSHHDLEPVDRFLEEARRRDLSLPGLFGVFFYRSANPQTLQRLSDFMPVPSKALSAEFEAGAGAEEICARTLRALHERGIQKVYVSNLKIVEASRRLDAVEGLLD